MATVPVILGQTSRLSLVMADGNTAKYPQVRIYQPGNSFPLATIGLTHTAQGMYECSYAPPALGTYQAVYVVYDDAGHTIVNTRYSRELDQLLVRDNIEQQILDLLTLVRDTIDLVLVYERDNIFIDNTVYDDCCQIVSSRIRLFESKAYCDAATDGGTETAGLVATYQIVADYEGPARMKTYRKVRL